MNQSQRQDQLSERRAALLARSALLRERIATQGGDLRASVEGIDRGIGLLRKATARPLMLTAAAAALFILKPGRALKWIARGALVTSLVRKAIKAVDNRQSQPPDRFGA